MFLNRFLPAILRLIGIFNSKPYILLLSTFILFSTVIPISAYAQGNFLLTPRRIVFDGTRRSIDLNLANTGQDTTTFAISIVQLRMKENGSFEIITVPDKDQNFADKNLRFFPRIVTLPPNEAQVIKVQVVRKGQLESGEYRSHFYFRSIPKVTPLDNETASIDSTEISVRLTPVFGITIPAIIRIGESDTKVILSVISLDDIEEGGPILKLEFRRTGNFSVYGNLVVNHHSENGVSTRVGVANGIAVYSPNEVRRFQLQLNNPSGVDFKKGKLQIVFSTSSDINSGIIAAVEWLLK